MKLFCEIKDIQKIHNFLCFQIIIMNDILAEKEYYVKSFRYDYKVININQKSMKKTTNSGYKNFHKISTDFFQNMKKRKKRIWFKQLHTSFLKKRNKK